MKIKIFSSSDVGKIENEVNVFIKDKEIIDIKQSLLLKESFLITQLLVIYRE